MGKSNTSKNLLQVERKMSKKVFRDTVLQLQRRNNTRPGGWHHDHANVHRPLPYNNHRCIIQLSTRKSSKTTTHCRTSQYDIPGQDSGLSNSSSLWSKSSFVWNRTTTSSLSTTKTTTAATTTAIAAAVFINGLLLSSFIGDIDGERNNISTTIGWNNTNTVFGNYCGSSSMVVQCHDGGGNCSNNHKSDNPLDTFLNQQERLSKSFVTASDLDQGQDDDGGGWNDENSLPVYTLDDLALHSGHKPSDGDDDNDTNNNESNCDSILISYGGLVYDITNFVQSKAHPGGSERLMRAAGKPLEPYWAWHGQHFETEIPLKILRSYCPIVGRLTDTDQEKVDEEVEQLQTDLLPQTIRIEWRNRNEIVQDRHTVQDVTLVQLQEKYPQTDQVSQVGCPNNKSKRRPVSTSVATGVTIQDLVLKNSINKNNSVNDGNIEVKVVDVTFYARDGEKVSISGTAAEPTTMTTATPTPIPDCEKCQHKQPINDVLLCYEMDGKPISRQRGFPIRAIIPGKRVVKWVERIVISYESS